MTCANKTGLHFCDCKILFYQLYNSFFVKNMNILFLYNFFYKMYFFTFMLLCVCVLYKPLFYITDLIAKLTLHAQVR